MDSFTLARLQLRPRRPSSHRTHIAEHQSSTRARAERRDGGLSIITMQHAPNYPGPAHMSNHTPILPAAGMADAYRLASLSAGSANSNNGQSSEAGPSNISPQSSSASLKRKSNAANGGRKKRAGGTDDSGDGQSSSAKARDGPKKKKAARACFHCQKAHLTCDDGVCRSPSACVYPLIF